MTIQIVMSKATYLIRKMELSEMDDILDIWLKASIKAHDFVKSEFWESQINTMREMYIPASETYVFVENNTIKGFFSLNADTLAALFVSTKFQSQSIGQKLIKKAKSLRSKLNLTVYKDNTRSIDFYLKSGFSISGERLDEHTGHKEILMEYNS